jgi:long-chain acyl-CoA synthetase
MPWLHSYPDGVQWDIQIDPAPVQDILDRTAATWPDKPALDFMGRRMHYGELLAQVHRAAKGLQRLGVKPGVHVGLYLPNTPHYVIAFFAVLKAGGTVVNYSPLDAAKVLEHKIEDSRTDFLFTLDMASLYPQMAAMLGRTRLKKLIVGTMAEMAPASAGLEARMKAAGQIAEVDWDGRHLRWQDLLDNDGDHTPHAAGDFREALAVLQYTGGTTGLPKGAMLTHANLRAACEQYLASVNSRPPVLLEGQERFLAVLPPFHIYALSVNMLLGIRLAAELILHVRFDAEAALKDIAEKKVTSFCGVPTMFTALIGHPDTPKYDLRSLRYCGSGGAPLPLEVAQRYLEVTGCPLNEGWGMTETSPTGTFTPVYGMRKAGSCGIPLPRIDIRMLSLDDPSRYVGPGEKGELCIMGPNVMKGYWNQPAATAHVTTFDGMMRTGDVAYMDNDGFVFIVDRCKDMLLCSGYNVYPRVLEEAIYQHPAVAEVGVIGIPDEYRGQSPKAFVQLRAGAQPFTLQELQAFLKDRLGKHEMVQALEICDALPKTPVGKLSKKDLIDEDGRRRTAAAAQA